MKGWKFSTFLKYEKIGMFAMHKHQTKKNIQNSFDWSMRPLIGLMKFIGGIDLHTSQGSKSKNNMMKNLLFTAWAVHNHNRFKHRSQWFFY